MDTPDFPAPASMRAPLLSLLLLAAPLRIAHAHPQTKPVLAAPAACAPAPASTASVALKPDPNTPCPKQPQPTCPVAAPPDAVPPDFWARYGQDTFFSLMGLLLGTVVSLYATVVFERYKRFRELLLDIAQARQFANAYASDTRQLEVTHQNAIAFWQTIERKRWSLDADGHHEAAAQVGRLQSFAYQSALCIEHMLNQQTFGLSLNQYLIAYQAAYHEAHRTVGFTAFERSLRPAVSALLRPWPHPPAPVAATAIVEDGFFRNLLG